MDNKYLTVGAITRYLKSKFDTDTNLKLVFLKGEISNFKAHTSGHLYFSVKDEYSKINAIMFRTNAMKIDFKPMDGTKVLIKGRISIYEQTGNYQIYVDEMIEDGVGNLYIAFEKLKKKLSAEGYFDAAHKKEIPKYPNRVGVITASTGAAIRDIITTIRRRYPICEIVLFPTLVQGENAKDDIVKNIKRAADYDLDVLIVGRGGGSIEDLWPFNEEAVAMAIYNCDIPIISAVGHEVDFTISDFVADLRAPTPTAAAEMAVPNVSDLSKMFNQFCIRLKEAICKKINYQKLYLEAIKSSYVLKTPMVMFENKKQNVDLIANKLNDLILRKIDVQKKTLKNLKKSFVLNNPSCLYKEQRKELSGIIDKLELLNPLKVLGRGYSITYSDGVIVKDVRKPLKDIKIRLYNGYVYAKVVRKVDEDGKEI